MERRGPGARGFTLLEIMAVIGLMGLLAAVLSVGVSRALQDRSESADDVFWYAIGEARKFALMNQTEVRLTFDNQEQVFRASTPLGEKVFPLPPGMEFDLEFLGVGKGTRSIMIGGILLEASELKHVRFFDDGTCTPFRAQLRVNDGQPIVYEIDPWTCAPVLRGEENR